VPTSAICISHDPGAGGEALAGLLAQRLGFRVVDQEIVALAAERADLQPEDLASVERRKSFLQRLVDDMGRVGEGELFAGIPIVYPDENLLRQRIRQAIEETADEGGVVIVAHAASFALAGRPDVLRVLVTASPAQRAKRLASDEALDAKHADKAVATHDANRADYLKRFYGVAHERPYHYDLVISTDTIPVSAAADIVAAAAASR
jgi:cytidylate kinase